MKREVYFLAFAFIFLFVVGFVSAGWFDFLKHGDSGVTGQVTSSPSSGYDSCKYATSGTGSWIKQSYLAGGQATWDKLGCPTAPETMLPGHPASGKGYDGRYTYQAFEKGGYCIAWDWSKPTNYVYSNYIIQSCKDIQGAVYDNCQPNWQCNSWSGCVKGKQTMQCNDLNACGSKGFSVSELVYHPDESEYFVVSAYGKNYLLSATISRNDDGYNRTTIKNEVTGMEINNRRIAGDIVAYGDAIFSVKEVYATPSDRYVVLVAGQGTSFNLVSASFEDSCEDSQQCTDSDGGVKRYEKGKVCLNGNCTSDYCKKEGSRDYLTEQSCSDNGLYGNDAWIYCNNGCSDGVCLKAQNLPASSCPELVSMVANPDNINLGSLKYDAGWGNKPYVGSWYIDGKEYGYTEYSSSWSANQYSQDEDKGSQHTSVYYFVDVFNNGTDLKSVLSDLVSYRVCRVDSYWREDNSEDRVYVCNLDILNDEQSDYDYESSFRNILWYHGNVLVRADVYSGRSLTDAEAQRIAEVKLEGFVASIKDNSFMNNEWKSFDMSYLSRDLLDKTLKMCASDVEMPVNEDNQTCYPNWQCKMEPAICPEYGSQKKICIDNACGQQREETYSCSPGVCSGCYVPRWFGYDSKFSNRDNICIPYGTRFEHQIGWKLEDVYVDDKDSEGLTVREALAHSGDVNLTVNADGTALLILEVGSDEYRSFNLVEGNSYPWNFESGNSLNQTLYVDKISYDSSNYEDSYIEVTLTVSGLISQQTKQSFNAYCDIDGQVKQQKTVDPNTNDWAKCQNNYECFSNICSSGECIQFEDTLRQVNNIKSLFVRVMCRLSAMFSSETYDQCVADNS